MKSKTNKLLKEIEIVELKYQLANLVQNLSTTGQKYIPGLLILATIGLIPYVLSVAIGFGPFVIPTAILAAVALAFAGATHGGAIWSVKALGENAQRRQELKLEYKKFRQKNINTMQEELSEFENKPNLAAFIDYVNDYEHKVQKTINKPILGSLKNAFFKTEEPKHKVAEKGETLDKE